MTPILYEKDEIDFTSQGLGSLVEIYDVDVEEQRNGLLQLTASYPVSGVRYADISVGRIILAKPNQRDDVHAFRIVSTELDISGYAVTIEADSITYDLTHNLVKHLVVSGNGQAFMTALKNAIVNPSIFEFYSDIATSSTTSLNYVNPMEAIMGTTGSFLQIWGGELKRENRRVAMFNRRGRDNVSTFRLGKNISGLKYSVDISSLVTRIIPTKSVQNDDQTTTTLEGAPVDSQYINNYEQIYTLPLEFTDDTIKTVADLNAAAKCWFTQSANTGRDKPTVTIDIDVLSLQDSADYQDKFKNLESVSLTDTVTVYVPEYGVNVTAIVNELHYDPILDRVTKMTVGTAKQSFADSSRTQLSDLQDKIISVQNQADAAAVSANGKNKNYYGSVEPSHPQEGDLWYWVDGDKSGVKQFVNGEWVDLVDSDTQEKIADAVDDAVAQANAHTDEVKQGLSTDIATAKSQAASQASTAEANAKSAATSQFTQAQSDLSQAKTDITNAYKTADGVVNKKIDDTASSITTTINQNKQDADGKISTAQTTATTALNGLSSKVSQTDYDSKTGQLTTSVSKAQQTADAVTTSLANYKTDADGRISANSADIVTNTNAIKQKVAQSDYDANNTKLTSRLTTVETTANGTATTVSSLQQTVNNLGQANLINNSNFFPDYSGWHVNSPWGNNVTNEVWNNGVNNKGAMWVWHDMSKSSSWLSSEAIPVSSGMTFSAAVWAAMPTVPSSGTPLALYITYYDANQKELSNAGYNIPLSSLNGAFKKFSVENRSTPSGAKYVALRFGWNTTGSISFGQPMLVMSSSVGDYVAGAYNNNAALAQVKITADGINNFVRDSSGNISSDFQTALGKSSVIVDGNNKMISLINQKSDEIVAQISSVNLFPNSEFESDYGYESLSGNTKLSLAYKWAVGSNQSGVVEIKTTASSYQGYVAEKISVFGGSTISFSTLLHYENGGFATGQAGIDMRFRDKDGNETGKQIKYLPQQNDYWTTVLMENIYVPDTSVSLSITLIVNDAGAGQYAVFAQPMLVNSSTIKKYSPNADITTTLMLLKDKWAIGLADNIGNITSGIIGDSSSMSLISKNIVLDGNTTVTGDFYAKGGNFKNLNASNMTVGTLNGTQVNITNINANNIVSGAISGANLNINLNTGSVVFQKGRINSSDYTTDINIDQGYISTANGVTRALLTQGKLQLIDPTLFSPQTSPYLEISNNSSLFNGMAALIDARDSLTVSIKGYDSREYGIPVSSEKFFGLSIGKYNNNLMPTKIGGASQGVIISGGQPYSLVTGTDVPYIYVGTDSYGTSPNGTRIYLNGNYVHSPSTYLRTSSGSANVYVAQDGALLRSSSARKYKLDIKNNIPIDDSLKLINVPLSTWVDKHEHDENGSNERYFGMIAEDLRDAGLEYLVQYGTDNEVEGINYDRVALLLIPLVKELKKRIEELESKGK